MTGHHESTGPDPALSRDSVRRVTQYQTAGLNARLKLFALLEAKGLPASEADDLVAALEAGASPGRTNTTARRRVLEALGEAGGLCTARTVNSDGDVIVCTRDAGHYDPDDKPTFKDGKPGGWHKADASIWNDLGAACIPHAAI
ncbi:hypothetical protein ACWEWX_36465 [Streptomyces asiaticus]